MKIQIPYRCKHYTPNFNLNRTCKNSKRCLTYYDIECKKYREVKNETERLTD